LIGILKILNLCILNKMQLKESAETFNVDTGHILLCRQQNQ